MPFLWSSQPSLVSRELSRESGGSRVDLRSYPGRHRMGLQGSGRVFCPLRVLLTSFPFAMEGLRPEALVLPHASSLYSTGPGGDGI